MLQLHNLSYSYRRGTQALQGVSCTLHSPSVAILGPNGAGKSTLLKLITTATTPQEGTFTAAGWSSQDLAGLRDYRRKLGVMPQALNIFRGYSCQEFLHYVAWLREVPVLEGPDRVEHALRAVELWDRREDPVKQLSGGMRQRLGLAQALVNQPQLLVLDEPTVGLDPRQRSEFRTYIRRLLPRTVVVLATHLVDDVAAIADEVLVLDAGQVRFAGPLRALCADRADGDITGADIEAAYLQLVEPER